MAGTRTGPPIIHEGHTNFVWSVVFAPDGNSVVSGSRDSTIRMWDARGPSTMGEPLRGHTSPVNSVAYSPRGDIIASGSVDKTIRLWDINTRLQVGAPLEGHIKDVNSVAFSTDGKLLASGSIDRTVRLWDVQKRMPACDPFKGHTFWVCSVAFHPDGTRIVTSSTDKTIRIWDVEHGTTVVGPLQRHTKWVQSVAVSPDGSQLISGSDDRTLRLWDTRSGDIIGKPFEGHTNSVYSVAFSPNGVYVASGSGDKTVRVWDVRTGRQVDGPFEQHTDQVRSVKFSPNGRHIASGSNDTTVIIWDVSHLTSDRTIDPQNMIDDDGELLEDDNTELVGPHRDMNEDNNGPLEDDITDLIGQIMDMIEDGKEPLKEAGMDLIDQHMDTIEGSHETSEDDSTEVIGQHMSVQDMYCLLLRHGCGDLSSQMDQNQNSAVLASGGGFGDIWRGELYDGTRIAIKTWREALIKTGDYKTLKRAIREIHIWSKMQHENVHQLLGVVMFKGQTIGMVSEWMENGNMHEYVRKNPKADRFKLCIEIASGLAYIHNLNMVHGDMKSFNVLVSSDGAAKLTDFGISTMFESSIAFSATTTSQVGSVRWVAPELLLEKPVKTKESDVYALGMTILEILTGTMPYPECPWDFNVMMKVSQGILPTRPTNQFKDDNRGNRLWALLVNCWNRRPDARPAACQVAESLTSIFTLSV